MSKTDTAENAIELDQVQTEGQTQEQAQPLPIDQLDEMNTLTKEKGFDYALKYMNDKLNATKQLVEIRYELKCFQHVQKDSLEISTGIEFYPFLIPCKSR